MNTLLRKCIAEALGTYILVFAGTGAMIVNDVANRALTHVGVSLVWGLVVMALIYALGETSGAHLNPAVSFGFFAARRFPAASLLPYVTAQILGAIAASVCLHLLFPEHQTLGITIPLQTVFQCFFLEMILTAILMLVILCVSTGSKEAGVMAGIAVGGTIGLEALFAGPITGASMNPARSLAPALISGNLADLWIYLTAPPLGACLGVAAWRVVRPPAILSPPLIR